MQGNKWNGRKWLVGLSNVCRMRFLYPPPPPPKKTWSIWTLSKIYENTLIFFSLENNHNPRLWWFSGGNVNIFVLTLIWVD